MTEILRIVAAVVWTILVVEIAFALRGWTHDYVTPALWYLEAVATVRAVFRWWLVVTPTERIPRVVLSGDVGLVLNIFFTAGVIVLVWATRRFTLHTRQARVELLRQTERLLSEQQ